MRRASCLAFAIVLFSLSTVVRADTTVGTNEPGNGNCFPFTCNNSGNSTGETSQYQEVYSSSAFGGSQTIYGLTFYFDNGGSTTVLSGTYDIYLSTTSAAVNALSSNPTLNRGSNFTLVDVFSGGVNSNPSFTIALTTPFNYNPATGNLLMEVDAFNQPPVTDTGENAFLQADHSGTFTSRAWSSNPPPTDTLVTDSIGLVTTFNTSPIAAPEPSANALLGLGFAALLLARKALR
jgi:hypothetical protein